jgi:hypothetical protein
MIFDVIFDFLKEKRNLIATQAAYKLRLAEVFELLAHDEPENNCTPVPDFTSNEGDKH